MTSDLPPGNWPSPITAELVSAGAITIGDMAVDGSDIYWVEGRPSEGGRHALVCERNGTVADVLSSTWSVRTIVHEYGGGAFAVHDGSIVFSSHPEGGLFLLSASSVEPVALCAENGLRFADFAFDVTRDRVIAVVEDHRGSTVENYLAAIPLAGGPPVVLVSGHDFFASPRLHPEGSTLAWISWDHPSMPWDATYLSIADLDASGMVKEPRIIAGGEHESVLQPSWSASGVLHFISDRTGWWNLYAERDGRIEALAPMGADCAPHPGWVFGERCYAFLDDGRIAFAAVHHARAELRVLALDGRIEVVGTPFTDLGYHVLASGSDLILSAGGPRHGRSVVRVDPATGNFSLIRDGLTVDVPRDTYSIPTAIAFPSGDAESYALFYPPQNEDAALTEDTLPPLIVRAHGGPTSAVRPSVDLGIQYWTSRGFAVANVDYRGSTGYGRPYREALYGEWGVRDVEDCLNAARHLAETGNVNGDAMFIMGGSAGGYIALLAVCGHDVFAGCVSLFGVANALALATFTHKFESRYLDKLIGPLPETEATYHARSPIKLVDTINTPILILQGLDDKVVLPAQSEMMRDGLRARGVPCAYIAFEGEGHGFRQAPNIRDALDAEQWFYNALMGQKGGDAPDRLDRTGF